MRPNGIKIFVFMASLHTWHLKGHAMHAGRFTVQYLRMTRSNLMLVFSGSGLLYQAKYTCHIFHSILQ